MNQPKTNPDRRKRRRFSSTTRGFITGILASGLLVFFVQSKPADSYFEISKNLDIFTSLFKELHTLYVDPVEPGQLIKTGIDAMLGQLDPFTTYITESDIEEYEFQTTGKYGGIGASLQRKGDQILIGAVYEHSPAHKAGLNAGDIILEIDGNKLGSRTLDEVSNLLKGSPGTKVRLQVLDAYSEESTEKIVTRAEIELSPVPYAGLMGENNQFAYVQLTQFTPGASRLIRHALDSLKTANPRMEGVVIDLRSNPGGLLDEAVKTCNLFIDRGELIVSTRGKLSEWDKDFHTPGPAWDLNIPVAVLINRSSASASEIVSGSLQDLDRGVVIGEKSYGKGLVQVTRSLGYNARLKLTTAKYYTPSGRCIQALDYSHRHPDGSVGEIPDSLKQEFKTRNGRVVYSGGGVEPDIRISREPISKLAITLYQKNYIFDFATHYAKTRPQISPVADFRLSERDFQDFEAWLEGKDYSYKTQTEVALDSLKAIAQREMYMEAIAPEFRSLTAKLSHDKLTDLRKHKEEVMELLENEIVSRYYFRKGRIEHNLRHDQEVNESIKILSQPQEYQALLGKP